MSFSLLAQLDVSGFDLETFHIDTAGMEIPHTGVLEHSVDPRRFVNRALLDAVGKACPIPSKVHLIEFSSIPLHVDSVHEDMRYIHLVLSGEFEMHVGVVSYTGKRGDLFFLNPHKPHSVYTQERCTTLCLEIMK
jgi:mannose-6-phosphate isomerase-like protein (cupin superfamily)